MPKRAISISVRELVEFVLRTGDLGTDRDFFGPTRALQGTRGHQRLQASRPSGYQAEVPLSHQLETADFVLSISGRLDGILPTPDAVLIEEIKTVHRGWSNEPDPLHWAQAKIYATIYLTQHGLDQIEVQLTYLDLDSDTVTPFRQSFHRRELQAFFSEITQTYVAWLSEQIEWWRLRDASIQSMTFPFPEFREGQQSLMSSAANVLARGGNLFVEAPTGIGKTIAVLFPAVNALARGEITKIFYLTAKTVGRTVAEKAFVDLRTTGLRLRALSFTAKEKLCFKNGQPCDVRTCPYAVGYYNRVRDARRSALNQETLTRSTLEGVAHEHQVCPAALSAEVSRWADAIICDYNYVFDPKVYFRFFFDQERGDYAFLIDEAHNLVDRAREMFSAELGGQEFLEVSKLTKSQLPKLSKLMARVVERFAAFNAQSPSTPPSPIVESGIPEGGASPSRRAAKASSDCFLFGSTRTHRSTNSQSFAIARKEAPAELAPGLRGFLTEAEEWLTQNTPASFREELLSLYFRVSDFLRTLEVYDDRYVTIVETLRDATRLKLFCLEPAPRLQKAIQRGRSAIFFSATLSPMQYFRDLFGRTPEDAVLKLRSPFPEENLRLLVADHIATDFKRRASTVEEVARAIGAVVQAKRGNYLVYFPSYRYLNQVLERFRQIQPTVPVLAQHSSMTEAAREAFLQSFRADQDQTLVGFAVMGGIFGEGIDLVGDRLVGAVIVGVGLPQLCLERDLIRAHFEAGNGAGFEYAYLFPGMTRVFQAVGRVIRSDTDRGVILLIDTRFGEPRYRELFPAWWQPESVRSVEEISSALHQFWSV